MARHQKLPFSNGAKTPPTKPRRAPRTRLAARSSVRLSTSCAAARTAASSSVPASSADASLWTPSSKAPASPAARSFAPLPPRRPAARSTQGEWRRAPEGLAGDSTRLEKEEEGSGSAVVDPPVLSPEMDSSVEKVSSDPRSPGSICVSDGGCGC